MNTILIVLAALAVVGLLAKLKSDKKKKKAQTPAPTPAPAPAPEPTYPANPSEGLDPYIITSDIGLNGEDTDKDDQQSWLKTLPFLNEINLVRLVSTSVINASGVQAFREIINGPYRRLYDKGAKDKRFPSPDYLSSICSVGARRAQRNDVPDAVSPGAKDMVDDIRKYGQKGKRVKVLVWGSSTTLAQAIHAAPDIKKHITVFLIGSTNIKFDPKSFDYLYNRHQDLDVYAFAPNTTGREFTGIYEGYNAKYKNQGAMDDFVNKVILTTPEIGDAWKKYPIHANASQWPLRFKSGDFPTVFYAIADNHLGDFKPLRGNWKTHKGKNVLANKRHIIFDDFIAPRLAKFK